MKKQDWDKAFPETPAVFTTRIEQTLQQIKEEQPVKKVRIRAALVAAVVTILMLGAAYAAIEYGQKWYYEHFNTIYQRHDPEKYQDIMANIQTELPQKGEGEGDKLVKVTLQDATWLKERNALIVSLTAVPQQPGGVELYGLNEVDQDGGWTTGPIEPGDEDSRHEHYLTGRKGFGPPQDVMEDPTKKLMLIDFDLAAPKVEGTQTPLPLSQSMTLTNQEGVVMAVLEISPEKLDAKELLKHADENGMVHFISEYDLYYLENNEFTAPIRGSVRYQIKIK